MIKIFIQEYQNGASGHAVINKDRFEFKIRYWDLHGYYLSFNSSNDIIFRCLGYISAYDFCSKHCIHTSNNGVWPYCDSLEDLRKFIDQLNYAFSKLDLKRSINIF